MNCTRSLLLSLDHNDDGWNRRSRSESSRWNEPGITRWFGEGGFWRRKCSHLSPRKNEKFSGMNESGKCAMFISSKIEKKNFLVVGEQTDANKCNRAKNMVVVYPSTDRQRQTNTLSRMCMQMSLSQLGSKFEMALASTKLTPPPLLFWRQDRFTCHEFKILSEGPPFDDNTTTTRVLSPHLPTCWPNGIAYYCSLGCWCKSGNLTALSH